jgi:acyl carrier protein
MNEVQKTELRKNIFTIIKTELHENANFYDHGIDSFSLVEIINSLEEFSKKHDFTVNMDALITEEQLTLQAIFSHIS